jgi:outer membrane protein assembly factor BamD (BamD/ComL family)
MLMLKLNFFSFLIFLNFVFLTSKLHPQEVDIVPYLKAIENGNIVLAKEALVDLKEKNPSHPSVMFLDAVLKENGQEAIIIYQEIVDNYPASKYADASLYRIFSYYYALGLYEAAREKLKHLKDSYPASPYIHVAEQNLSVLEQPEVKEKEPFGTETKPSAGENYKFTIQAGAFTNPDNAKKLLSEFESSGIFCDLREKIVGGTTFHVVYAGKFLKYEDAESFLQVINSRFKLNGNIVPIPSGQK